MYQGGKKGLFLLPEKEMPALEPIQRETGGTFKPPCLKPAHVNLIRMAGKSMDGQRQRLQFLVAKARANTIIGPERIQRHGEQFRILEHFRRRSVLLAKVGMSDASLSLSA